MGLMIKEKSYLSYNVFSGGISLIILLLLFSCQKDPVDNDPGVKLNFSQDTVFFDTVFTSLGSTIQSFTVHNKGKQRISITSIRLAGGTSSFYRMNVDGQAANEVKDIDIDGEDSLYIFCRVTIDPTDERNPFVISDSIVFETNGNIQDVNLVAWGQNANYILADTYIPGYPKFKIIAHENETARWTADKPYVIYGFAVVDSTGSLEIERGTRVYFHNNSGLWIYKGGNIKAKGSVDAPIIFQGDRLESFYQDMPGQWDRIWINEGSVNNEIEYAIIRNGFIGLQLETIQEQMGNQLILSNTRIENMTGYGILTRFYNLTAYNNVVVNCSQYLAAFTWGGIYDIRQCTFANYWSASVRVTPSIVLNNYATDTNDIPYLWFEFQGYFGNNIFYGRNDDELLLLGDTGAPFQYQFDHCLLRTTLDVSDPGHYPGCLVNEDPLFFNYLENNYQLDTLSPLIDKGNPEVIRQSFFDLHRDIIETNRPEDLPDIGAYEFIKPE
ncbi:MAG: hypothetical protein M0Q51_04725 [Bacteroidales bacterium]|nr:hypothetical protein [Bacteroidales bacterium]